MSALPLPPASVLRWVVPLFAVLACLPWLVEPYQTTLFSYGLVMAIAALGFNLLLGYTGLLSFGHSAYFGVGAYAVALLVKYLKITSLEILVVGGIIASALVSALFGFVCVRYTKIFFGILTMALSQVLWSLAYKFFWVTGGSDGLRVPTPSLLGTHIARGEDKMTYLAHRYYYYVLLIFAVCTALMWVIVHSPFGKALQAIRDNETRAEFVGVQVRHYRWVAFVVSGTYTGLAGALWVIVHSPFGKALQAIRDNETRAEFVGVQVRHYRWVAFVVSGTYTGLAGALWVPLNGLTTPDILHWTFSGEIVFFTVLGGFGTFTGPIVGAIVFNYLKTFAVGYTVYWQMFLGVVLVTLVLALPTGIMGMVGRLLQSRRKAPAS